MKKPPERASRMLDQSQNRYRVLTAGTVAAYLAGLPAIREILGEPAESWRVRDVADGNLNSVFLVDGPEGGVCLKQALPYVRVVGESWPLDVERARFEASYMARLAPHVGRLAPRIVHWDPEQYAIVMEKLEPHIILRKGLMAGMRFPNAARNVAEYVAQAAFHTSDLAIPFERKCADLALFSGNVALQRITVDLVFSDPYVEVWRNKIAPGLDAWAGALRTDAGLKGRVAELRLAYLSRPQSLLHGDLHSGSVMVTSDDTRVIDGEFSWVGPTGFDIGSFLAHYVMAWYAKPYHDGSRGRAESFRLAIADDIADFWLTFRRRFLDIWQESETTGDGLPAAHFADAAGRARLALLRQSYVDAVFQDAVGFMAVKIIRRIVGFAQIADFLTIADDHRRAAAQAGALALARALLRRPDRFSDIASIIEALPKFEGAGFDPYRQAVAS
jgi:5-methylthioribose kinase